MIGSYFIYILCSHFDLNQTDILSKNTDKKQLYMEKIIYSDTHNKQEKFVLVFILTIRIFYIDR